MDTLGTPHGFVGQAVSLPNLEMAQATVRQADSLPNLEMAQATVRQADSLPHGIVRF